MFVRKRLKITVKNNDYKNCKNEIISITQVSHQPDIDKIYLYAKVPYEAKYQLLIKVILPNSKKWVLFASMKAL